MLKFQPTRPLRGATTSLCFDSVPLRHFNPRAPCGARLWLRATRSPSPRYFNPRAPCGARRQEPCAGECRHCDFNPRAPCGARRGDICRCVGIVDISTHAPLAGRDVVRLNLFSFLMRFQPTRPLRGATIRSTTAPKTIRISTHAPLAGRDAEKEKRIRVSRYFNPRAPCGARHYTRGNKAKPFLFQPTRPLRGATTA